MATATKVAKKTPATKAPAAKKAPAVKRVATKTASPAAKKAVSHAAVKETFTKAVYLAEQSQVEPKAVKAVLAALEAVVLGSVHKKGAGEFTLPGLLKLTVQSVPAKKKRFGKDPFTGEDRWFDAKPASVKVKARALKKLKDAAA
jgi:hypothetical protein